MNKRALGSARQCVGPNSEADVSRSVATRVEADIPLVRDTDTSRGPGLLGASIGMRAITVLGEVGNIGWGGKRRGCHGCHVEKWRSRSIGGKQG